MIGLGEIGGAVAERLAAAGILVAVYDIRTEAMVAVSGNPRQAASPAELGRLCDVVLLADVDAVQAEKVLSGQSGLLHDPDSNLLVVLLATIALDDLARLRALAAVCGIALIDSGVIGSRDAREKGLICLFGAEPADLQRAMPAFDGFARRVSHMGPPGAGMTDKIIYNGILIACQTVGYEGAALAPARSGWTRWKSRPSLRKAVPAWADHCSLPLVLAARTTAWTRACGASVSPP